MVSTVTITAITNKGEQAIRESLDGDKKEKLYNKLMFKAYKFHKDVICESPLTVQFSIGDVRVQQLLEADSFEHLIRSRLDCDNDDVTIEVE